jgi:hypothetical protein
MMILFVTNRDDSQHQIKEMSQIHYEFCQDFLFPNLDVLQEQYHTFALCGQLLLLRQHSGD